MKTPSPPRPELPIAMFENQAAWADWLAANHASSSGLWLRHAKKASNIPTVTYHEALDMALCYGWIDGQKKSYDETTWLQKWTPRGKKSIWSKINREKVQALIEQGQMQSSGLREVERARLDGRWEAAYDSQSTATVPDDFGAALELSPSAKAFFTTLNSANRYAILFRIQTAKKAETRTRRIAEFIGMLERQEQLHS